MLSVSDWRISRLREAPSASRMEACMRPAVPRASNRLATLAQAMSSTKPDTSIRIRKASW